MSYPQVIATSVVRSTHQGESHGGIYIVDLETERYEQVVDWNTTEIDWQGRGHDRGLRGIAFWHDHVLVAASDALLVYDRTFRLVETHRNRYLRHAHEIDRLGDRLWLTSTGFDALLAFDLRQRTFVHGIGLRLGLVGHVRRRLWPATQPRARPFDPQADDGPTAGDTVHLNTVIATSDGCLASGTRLGCQLRVHDGRASRFARIPLRTHNVRPYRDGVLLQDTARDRVLFADRRGRPRESWPLPRYDAADLTHGDLPADHARQAFGRGLCVTDDGTIIAGSSPSTISAFRHGDPEPQRQVTLTMDVRNAIHGLEVFRPRTTP